MNLNLGNQLRINRRRMNLTQEQLAERFGTSPQAISRWENGTTYPDIELLPMIASFFGMSVDALLGCTDEQKEKICMELQESLMDVVKKRDVEKTVGLLREIRRNLREYSRYWFWGIYHEIWKARLFRDEQVLEELRLLTEEIFETCPRSVHFAAIENMAFMESDDRIDAFLDAYASREDMSRSRLLFNRYKMREELEKCEPVRQFILWHELSHIISAANDWQEYLCKDPAHFKWFCETQLHYLNEVNCLTPDKKHLVSGSEEPDLWCEPRVQLGLRYTRALASLGRTDDALDVFEDTVSIIERVMRMEPEEFRMGCQSPALKGFALNAKFYWLKEGEWEYRALCLESNGWNDWIIPKNILQSVTNDSWFGPISINDAGFDPLLDRLKRCVIRRKPQNEKE